MNLVYCGVALRYLLHIWVLSHFGLNLVFYKGYKKSHFFEIFRNFFFFFIFGQKGGKKIFWRGLTIKSVSMVFSLRCNILSIHMCTIDIISHMGARGYGAFVIQKTKKTALFPKNGPFWNMKKKELIHESQGHDCNVTMNVGSNSVWVGLDMLKNWF